MDVTGTIIITFAVVLTEVHQHSLTLYSLTGYYSNPDGSF